MLLDTTLGKIKKKGLHRTAQVYPSLFDSIISISFIQSLNDYGTARKVL